MTAAPLPPAPLSPAPARAADNEHLRLLALFHTIIGILTAIFACLPLIHVFLGVAMIVAPDMAEGSNAPPAFVGVLFAAMGMLFVLLGWALAICTIVSGRFIRQRRRRLFSVVVAAILCTLFPFGTVLGVFTIIVLSRESVRQLYGEPV